MGVNKNGSQTGGDRWKAARSSENAMRSWKRFAAPRPTHPDISLATVYRNLALFKSQGTIASVGIVGGVERFDGNTDPHVHFICTQCGAVMDLPQISVPEELNSAVAQSSGGRVDNCQLSFTGICGECRKLN